MTKLTTRSQKKTFTYYRDTRGDITIQYGSNFTAKISAVHFHALLKTFHGQKAALGTSRDKPPPNSIGHWLQSHVTPTAIASYVGPILVHENLAEWATPEGKALILKIH